MGRWTFVVLVLFLLTSSVFDWWPKLGQGRSVKAQPTQLMSGDHRLSQHRRDVHALMQSMTIEQKVGQMVMAGFPGTSVGPEVTQLVKDRHVGGVILFARNVKHATQVAELSNELQAMATSHGARIPLFISADQEGGIVVRIQDQTTDLPGHMALGATRSEKYAEEAGAMTARELRAVGVNVNFAPVMDVNNNPSNPVIGVRSIGEDPEVVANLGSAYIRGLQQGGVSATAKHFPGHGDTALDSHIALPTINHPRGRLDTVELVPFRAAIENDVDLIMTAHITFPAVDPTPGLPATLSHAVLTGLLRNEMGFEGLIITDAMEMDAIAQNFGQVDAAVKAVEAGVDIVLVAWPADWYDAVRVIDGLVDAVRSGRLSEERIDRSVQRILLHKAARGISENVPVDTGQIDDLMRREEDVATALAIATDAVTLIKNEGSLVPLDPNEAGPVVVVTPSLSSLTIAETSGTVRSTLGYEVSRRGMDVTELTIGTNPTTAERNRVIRAVADAQTIIIATYRANDAQAQLVNRLIQLDKDLIVVSVREPYDLMRFPDAPVYIATYGYMPLHMEAFGRILFGEAPIKGRLPVSLPGQYPIGHGITTSD